MTQNNATQEMLSMWMTQFPGFELTIEDLKKPIMVMKAIFKMLDRIGIDIEVLLQPPTERELNEHLPYYQDLVPVINLTRIINYYMRGLPHLTAINLNHLLSPGPQTSTSVVLVLLNAMLFMEGRMAELAPREEPIFAQAKIAQELEQKRLELQEALNNQAEGKGKSAMRIEQMNNEIAEGEEQLSAEQKGRDQYRVDVETITKENEAFEKVLEQKKATVDNLRIEMERLKSLRVCDADEVKAKTAQATQRLQEADEKLSSLGTRIAEKENSLKILQTKIKPCLDTANNLLDEITKLKEEELDLDAESKDGELQVLSTMEAELKSKLGELKARREEAQRRRRDVQDKREQERLAFESGILDAEEKAKKHREFIYLATERAQQLKEETKHHEQEKEAGIKHIGEMKEDYYEKYKGWEDALMQLMMKYKMDFDSKLSDMKE